MDDERLRPMPCWMAEHASAAGLVSVVLVHDGMTAWSGTDGTLRQTVDLWLRVAVEHVRERSSLGDDEDGWLTTRPPLDVLVDVEERWEVVHVSHDVVERLAYHLRVDLERPVPHDLAGLVAYVITWAAALLRLPPPPVEDDPLAARLRWTPPRVEAPAPREDLRTWARHWRPRLA